MSLASRIPLSPLGWAAVGLLAVAVAGTALVIWPRGAPPFACALDAPLSLPSGRAATLCEVIPETQPFSDDVWLVLRVVVPDLPASDADGAHADHDWVCEARGLQQAEALSAPPARVVVQLMAAPFPRGHAAPDTRQQIEAYTVSSGRCIWELL